MTFIEKIKEVFSWLLTKLRKFWPWYKSLYQGKAWYTKTGVGILSLFVLFIVYLGAVDINFLWLFGRSPGFFTILHPQTNQASEIYSADGKLIGKFFNENRTPVKYEEVNPAFFHALIDTEDERYYKRPRGMAVDPIGIFGAVKDALLRHDGRGASTISQQLAKNMFRVRRDYSTGMVGKIPGLKILVVKSKEWIIATKLEICHNKKEIITMYANTVDFGSNAYGIKTAAKTYFNKSPKDLTTDECAILVGMLKATSYYNPKTNPEHSLARRNTVLHNMLTHHDLTREGYDSLSVKPIKLDFKVEENYDGQAMYFREAVANNLKDWCDENGLDLYTAGLKIYTTIDTRMQKYAEDAARSQMKTIQQKFDNRFGITRSGDSYHIGTQPWMDENGNTIPNFIQELAERQPFYKDLMAKYPNHPDSVAYYYKEWKHPVKLFDYNKGTVTKMMTSEDSIKYMTSFMHTSLVAMEPQTGYVKAYVGDIDFKAWKYDKASAERQPGSTFKLFVYTEAMQQGLTPCDKRRDEFISMKVYDKKKHEEVTWTPGNANGSFSGDSMPLKSAFAKSINSVAVRLGQEVGIDRIIDVAKKMGIKSPLDNEPSLALGSSDVNLVEMVNAYCCVANNGKHVDPVLVVRIVDNDGKEVYKADPEESQAISETSAFLMQQMLQGGMKEPGGTSQSLWGYVGNYRDTEFGGKTGTSNNHSDAWFMCVSPKLVAGAWVGGEYRSIHFRTGADGQGARTALPVVGAFLKKVFADPAFKEYHGKFDKPGDEVQRSMYICPSYYPKAKVDTTANDSTAEAEEIELDENGNPIVVNKEETDEFNGTENSQKQNSQAPVKTPKTEKKQKKEEEVNFNDL